MYTAYDYVIYAEHSEIEEEIKLAMLNYIKVEPNNWLSDKYRKRLGMEKEKKSLLSKNMNWNKKE